MAGWCAAAVGEAASTHAGSHAIVPMRDVTIESPHSATTHETSCHASFEHFGASKRWWKHTLQYINSMSTYLFSLLTIALLVSSSYKYILSSCSYFILRLVRIVLIVLLFS